MSKQAVKDKRYTEVAPNAAKTLLALREMGYDSFSSVLDLIDNAIDAKATKIAVTVRETGKSVTIDIRDDGIGMSEERLTEALRLGSDVNHNEKKDLGKFGMGLVTASISMARNLYVLTRMEGKAAYEATFDYDTIERENRFIITLRAAAKSDRVLDLIGDHGTLVKLSMIDRLNDSNVQRFAQRLRDRIGQTYRRFIDKGVKIMVNNRSVDAVDPLMRKHELTQVVYNDDVTIDKKTFHLTVAYLPELGQSGDAEANITPHNSGFYVVRNDREIMEAQTFDFYVRHHSYSHFRAELSFTGNFDGGFHVDIKKQTIHPDKVFLEKLGKQVERFIADAGKRGRIDMPVKLKHSTALFNSRLPLLLGVTQATPSVAKLDLAQGEEGKRQADKKQARKLDIVEDDKKAKAVQPSAPTVKFAEEDLGETGRFFKSDKQGNDIVITYNTRHPFVRLVGDIRSRQAHDLVDMIALALSRAESDVEGGNKVVNLTCDYLKALSAGE